MWIIRENASRNNIKWLRKLSELERIAILHTFSNQANKQQHELAHKTLQNIKHRRYWLACDCKQQPPAIMTICQRNDSLYLRRVISFPEHKPNCPLYHKASQQPQLIRLNKRKPNPYFGIYNVSSAVLPKLTNTHTNQQNNSADSLPSLGRNLFNLLEQSGLTHIPATPLTINQQYMQLKQTVARLNIAKGINLQDYFWTHPSQTKLAGAILAKHANNWPKPSLPHGFMLVVAQDISTTEIICNYKQQKINIKLGGKIQQSSYRLKQASGPWLVLLSIAPTAQQTYFSPMDAFAIPTYANYLLCPVESQFERLVLKKLLQLQAALLHKHQLSLKISKPLYAIESIQGGNSRPDFLITSKNKTLVIEVMGSHEESYMTRKQQTHQSMQNLGTLISIDAYQAEKTRSWDNALTTLSKQIYAEFLS